MDVVGFILKPDADRRAGARTVVLPLIFEEQGFRALKREMQRVGRYDPSQDRLICGNRVAGINQSFGNLPGDRGENARETHIELLGPDSRPSGRDIGFSGADGSLSLLDLLLACGPLGRQSPRARELGARINERGLSPRKLRLGLGKRSLRRPRVDSEEKLAGTNELPVTEVYRL